MRLRGCSFCNIIFWVRGDVLFGLDLGGIIGVGLGRSCGIG